MAKKKIRFKKPKPNFPTIQGNLANDTVTQLCKTGLYKTTFDLIGLNTGKIYPCVFWSNLEKIEKGQLVIIAGFKSNDCIICKDIKKIKTPIKY